MAVQTPVAALTERSAIDLARAIRGGEMSSRDVVEAHIEQLERTHVRINAVVFDRYDAARADADDADALLRCTPDPDTLPPFFGVPCTIKESIAMAGMPNCAGLVSRSAWRATQNAPTVQRMIDAGAIALGVTIPLGLNDRGLPLGIQAAVAPGSDHVAVAVALQLERAFGGWVPPTPPTGLART